MSKLVVVKSQGSTSYSGQENLKYKCKENSISCICFVSQWTGMKQMTHSKESWESSIKGLYSFSIVVKQIIANLAI
jgi:hypothetical protein